jgi:hypothetical protein
VALGEYSLLSRAHRILRRQLCMVTPSYSASILLFACVFRTTWKSLEGLYVGHWKRFWIHTSATT